MEAPLKFKVGDEIVIIKVNEDNEGKYGNYFLGDIGTITKMESLDRLQVTFPPNHLGMRDRYAVCASEAELSELAKSPLWQALK